jgi:hypothetical protein
MCYTFWSFSVSGSCSLFVPLWMLKLSWGRAAWLNNIFYSSSFQCVCIICQRVGVGESRWRYSWVNGPTKSHSERPSVSTRTQAVVNWLNALETTNNDAESRQLCFCASWTKLVVGMVVNEQLKHRIHANGRLLAPRRASRD